MTDTPDKPIKRESKLLRINADVYDVLLAEAKEQGYHASTLGTMFIAKCLNDNYKVPNPKMVFDSRTKDKKNAAKRRN